jgi:hypothetical protein
LERFSTLTFAGKLEKRFILHGLLASRNDFSLGPLDPGIAAITLAVRQVRETSLLRDILIVLSGVAVRREMQARLSDAGFRRDSDLQPPGLSAPRNR